MEKKKEGILATPQKIIGIGASLSIQHLAKKLQREYGEGTLMKSILQTIEKTAKKNSSS